MGAEFSPVGKRKTAVYGLIVAFDIVILALAARVNIFQEFFCELLPCNAVIADLFPFALSIVTLVLFLLVLFTDMNTRNTFITRPACEISLLFILSIFWLSFNAFSTSRWQHIPLACSSIPSEYADERTWCTDVQALKAFVWIQFVALFLTAVFLLRYVLVQSQREGSTIWNAPLSRYNPWSSFGEEESIAPRSLSRMSTLTDFFGKRNSATFAKF